MTRPVDLIFEQAARLDHAGLPSPGADARILVAHAVGCEVGELLGRWEISDDDAARAIALVDRRLAGEPVQHITGEAHFRYETLDVGPGVFIPRPETELLAGWAIDFLAARPAGERCVVELCAGSGAITRSIVRELGGVNAHVNERSRDAEPYLRRNLESLPVELHIGDMADAFPALDGAVDLVVVNPPYVPTALRDELPRDVVGHDPDDALFSGPEGLDAIRVVVDVALRLLKSGGAVAIEHDDSHQAQVLGILAEKGFVRVEGHQDLTGRDRFATALRAGSGGDDVARWAS